MPSETFLSLDIEIQINNYVYNTSKMITRQPATSTVDFIQQKKGCEHNKMNRRVFLKVAVSTTAIGLGGLDAALALVSQSGNYNICNNCSAANIKTWSNLPFNSLQPTRYCYGCGINMSTAQYDIQCNEIKSKGVCSCGFTFNCCQVPFVNPTLLTKSTKPAFMLSKLHF
ncbi:MAG: hypothetical protein KKD63_12625 [Proteobacteria bacterium]|nr:hypothetical protein [Desulfobulbaceae bacterium]MBU4153714.1 hypothetical protein [Pseudomonadota bacterium]